jgi:hypothetical protein
VERKHRLEAKVSKVKAHASANASMSMSMSFNLGPGGFSALLAGADEENESNKENTGKYAGNGSGKNRRVMADEEPLICIQHIMRMIN